MFLASRNDRTYRSLREIPFPRRGESLLRLPL